VLAAVPTVFDIGMSFPPLVDRIALGLTLFYFGSR